MLDLSECERIRFRTDEEIIHGLVGLALQQTWNVCEPENWYA
jgi:hypothetical protein